MQKITNLLKIKVKIQVKPEFSVKKIQGAVYAENRIQITDYGILPKQSRAK